MSLVRGFLLNIGWDNHLLRLVVHSSSNHDTRRKNIARALWYRIAQVLGVDRLSIDVAAILRHLGESLACNWTTIERWHCHVALANHRWLISSDVVALRGHCHWHESVALVLRASSCSTIVELRLWHGSLLRAVTWETARVEDLRVLGIHFKFFYYI